MSGNYQVRGNIKFEIRGRAWRRQATKTCLRGQNLHTIFNNTWVYVNTTRKHNGGNDTRLTGYRVWLERSNTTVVNLDSVGPRGKSATFIACDDNLHKYLTHFVAKVSSIRIYTKLFFIPQFWFSNSTVCTREHCSFCNVLIRRWMPMPFLCFDTIGLT